MREWEPEGQDPRYCTGSGIKSTGNKYNDLFLKYRLLFAPVDCLNLCGLLTLSYYGVLHARDEQLVSIILASLKYTL